MSTELTPDEKMLLAREVAADQHDRHWPHVTSYGQLPRESFLRGWDAALAWVEERHEAVNLCGNVTHCDTCAASKEW